MTSLSYEEQTRKLLAEAKAEQIEVTKQIEELQERREQLAYEVSGYEYALQGYLRRVGKQSSADTSWIDNLHGKTHKDKILELARRNGGIIKIGQATDILFPAGLIKSKNRQNAYIVLQKIFYELEEKQLMEKIAPAEYRIIGSQPNLSISGPDWNPRND